MYSVNGLSPGGEVHATRVYLLDGTFPSGGVYSLSSTETEPFLRHSSPTSVYKDPRLGQSLGKIDPPWGPVQGVRKTRSQGHFTLVLRFECPKSTTTLLLCLLRTSRIPGQRSIHSPLPVIIVSRTIRSVVLRIHGRNPQNLSRGPSSDPTVRNVEFRQDSVRPTMDRHVYETRDTSSSDGPQGDRTRCSHQVRRNRGR